MKTLITAKSLPLHRSCATVSLIPTLALAPSLTLTIRWRNEQAPLATLRHYDNRALQAS